MVDYAYIDARNARVVKDYVDSGQGCLTVGRRHQLSREMVRKIVNNAKVVRTGAKTSRRKKPEEPKGLSERQFVFSIPREWWLEAYAQPDCPSCALIAAWLLGYDDNEYLTMVDKRKVLGSLPSVVFAALVYHRVPRRPRTEAIVQATRVGRATNHRLIRQAKLAA